MTWTTTWQQLFFMRHAVSDYCIIAIDEHRDHRDDELSACTRILPVVVLALLYHL